MYQALELLLPFLRKAFKNIFHVLRFAVLLHPPRIMVVYERHGAVVSDDVDGAFIQASDPPLVHLYHFFGAFEEQIAVHSDIGLFSKRFFSSWVFVQDIVRRGVVKGQLIENQLDLVIS